MHSHVGHYGAVWCTLCRKDGPPVTCGEIGTVGHSKPYNFLSRFPDLDGFPAGLPPHVLGRGVAKYIPPGPINMWGSPGLLGLVTPPGLRGPIGGSRLLHANVLKSSATPLGDGLPRGPWHRHQGTTTCIPSGFDFFSQAPVGWWAGGLTLMVVG